MGDHEVSLRLLLRGLSFQTHAHIVVECSKSKSSGFAEIDWTNNRAPVLPKTQLQRRHGFPVPCRLAKAFVAKALEGQFVYASSLWQTALKSSGMGFPEIVALKSRCVLSKRNGSAFGKGTSQEV